MIFHGYGINRRFQKVNAETWNDYTGGVLTSAACGPMGADYQAGVPRQGRPLIPQLVPVPVISWFINAFEEVYK